MTRDIARAKASARARALGKALIGHHSSAFRRTGDEASAYRVRAWWWDKPSTDALLADTEDCLAALDDVDAADQLRWHRYAVYWQLGRFEEAEADLVALNRPGGQYATQIGQPLGLIRRRKFMHEGV